MVLRLGLSRRRIAAGLLSGVLGLLGVWLLSTKPPASPEAMPVERHGDTLAAAVLQEAPARTPSVAVAVDAVPAVLSHPSASVPDLTLEPETESDFLAILDRLNVDNKEQALRWAERGEGWYGQRGIRAEARRAMQVTLLVDLGRMSEARSLVREFIVQYPESRYRRLVQGVTGIHPRPGPQ